MGKGSSPPERKDLQSQGKTEKPCIFLKSKRVNHQVVSCPPPKMLAQIGLGCRALPSWDLLPRELTSSASQGKLDQGWSHLPLRWEGRVPAGGKDRWVMWPSTSADIGGDLAKATAACGSAGSSGKGLGCECGFGSPGCRRSCLRGNPGLINEALLQMQISVMLDLNFFFFFLYVANERRGSTFLRAVQKGGEGSLSLPEHRLPPRPLSGSPSPGGHVSH